MEADESTRSRRGDQPVFPLLAEVTDLPDEFADYLAGAAAISDLDGDETEARKHWERLLARPASERKFKSTWAAFMLGKTWEEKDDDKAVEYFQMVRDLAKRGFADSTCLAVAAIGLEARVRGITALGGGCGVGRGWGRTRGTGSFGKLALSCHRLLDLW
jgi:hypothetical protein